jgi:hypothetical protein
MSNSKSKLTPISVELNLAEQVRTNNETGHLSQYPAEAPLPASGSSIA